ncbi:MAG: redox-sensing transcriptional repressor Rex [bacterium]
MKKIPLPAMERLCAVYGLLEKLQKSGVRTVSSSQIGHNISATKTTVRKDISYLEMPGRPGKDYEIEKLKKHISQALKLYRLRRACIVGLGRIGTAILAYEQFRDEGFEIAAGFDISINKIERIVTPVSLYPLSDLKQVISAKNIEIGIICVPPETAQVTAEALVEAGIKGILNFSPAIINVPPGVITRNVDFTSYLRILSANISLVDKK